MKVNSNNNVGIYSKEINGRSFDYIILEKICWFYVIEYTNKISLDKSPLYKAICTRCDRTRYYSIKFMLYNRYCVSKKCNPYEEEIYYKYKGKKYLSMQELLNDLR